MMSHLLLAAAWPEQAVVDELQFVSDVAHVAGNTPLAVVPLEQELLEAFPKLSVPLPGWHNRFAHLKDLAMLSNHLQADLRLRSAFAEQLVAALPQLCMMRLGMLVGNVPAVGDKLLALSAQG